jgi:hypothetical protein
MMICGLSSIPSGSSEALQAEEVDNIEVVYMSHNVSLSVRRARVFLPFSGGILMP